MSSGIAAACSEHNAWMLTATSENSYSLSPFMEACRIPALLLVALTAGWAEAACNRAGSSFTNLVSLDLQSWGEGTMVEGVHDKTLSHQVCNICTNSLLYMYGGLRLWKSAKKKTGTKGTAIEFLRCYEQACRSGVFETTARKSKLARICRSHDAGDSRSSARCSARYLVTCPCLCHPSGAEALRLRRGRYEGCAAQSDGASIQCGACTW